MSKDDDWPAWHQAHTARLELYRQGVEQMIGHHGVSVDEREEGQGLQSTMAEPTAASSSSTDSAPTRSRAGRPPCTIADDLEQVRTMAMTPASFQPQRHVWYVCGRPVIVPLETIFLSPQFKIAFIRACMDLGA